MSIVILYKVKSKTLYILHIDIFLIVWYNDYSKEKELTIMKNNNYRRHTYGKYGYFPKKLLNKRVRKAGKKIEYEKD